jgi:hypothetical protein
MKYYFNKHNSLSVCYKVRGNFVWWWSWVWNKWVKDTIEGYTPFSDKKTWKLVTQKQFEARIKKGII